MYLRIGKLGWIIVMSIIINDIPWIVGNIAKSSVKGYFFFAFQILNLKICKFYIIILPKPMLQVCQSAVHLCGLMQF